MKSILRWLALVCIGATLNHAAPPPHPTRVSALYKDKPWPVLRLTGMDPIVLMDGHEKRIRQRVTYYPERARAFGPGYVDVTISWLSGNPNNFVRVDLGAGVISVNVTLKSETDLRGAFLMVGATKPQKESEQGKWPKTYFLAKELPELKAGTATLVEQRLVLMDVVVGMDCFIQIFDAEGREIPTNVMQKAWAYFHAQEVRQLDDAMPDYLRKFAGQNREPFPLVHPAPYFSTKDVERPKDALVRLTVSAKGRVTKTSVEGIASADTEAAVREAFMGWLFFPRLRNGAPVEAVVEVPVKF